MKKAYIVSPDEEPMGIVISRGSRAEPVPIFAAYIWGPAPEPAHTDERSKAA